MAAPNYRQAKRQKEIARKALQQVKQQRRSARAETPEAGAELPASDAAALDSKTDTGTTS